MMISLPAFTQNLMDSINQFDSFTVSFLVFWGIFSLSWYAWLYFFNHDHRKTPPGPPGLPLIGNLLSLDPDLHTHFATLSQTYGPIFSLQLGTKYGVVITSPSLARQVLKDHDVIFANHDVPIAGRVATFGGRDVAFSPYGSEWRKLRKVLMQWIITSTALGSVHKLRRNHEVQKTVSYLYGRVGSPVDIGEQMFVTVLNMNTNIIWGGTVEDGDEMTEMGGEFRELMSRVFELIGKPNLSDFFPGLAWFDFQGVEKQMNLLVRKFDQIFDKVIKQLLKKKKEKEIGGSENAGESKNFLEFMLNLKDEEQDSKTPLTMANIKALLMNMVVGGTDTSSNTMEFAMAHMISKPEVMRRAQQELDKVVGKNNMVQESHIQNLPYLHAVMKETLRLHPIAPLLIPHCPSETAIIGGYTIPKGCRVFVNLWALHRDPSIWDNPLHFDPTRFLDSQLDFRGNDFSYLPFGSGRRMCPGMVMAEKTFMYCVATLMHLFDWKLPHQGQKLDMSEKFGLTLKMKTPLVAIPTPRLSNLALYK